MPLLSVELFLLLHVIIHNWMIPFAAYTTAETPNAYQWAGKPQIALWQRDLNPYLLDGSYGRLYLVITVMWPKQ